MRMLLNRQDSALSQAAQITESLGSGQGEGDLSDSLRKARLEAHSEAAQARRAKTIADRQRFLAEDVLLLRRRGLVPLAIADELSISLRRVVEYLEEAGEEIPSYLTTWNEPPRQHLACPHCGAVR